VARGDRAWVSHHVGDLEHAATLTAYVEGIAHFERLFAVAPEVIAADLHPGYFSTQYALERDGVEVHRVQHHHAHLAAVLAEHGLAGERAVGAIYDGTGYGPDGTVWGGELLAGDLASSQRVAWLAPVPMPGGAAAVRQPWRMAWAWLAAACPGEKTALSAVHLPGVDPARWRAIAQVAAARDVSPLTSSMGRLFDAVAALCGLRTEVSYEGQAAVELEAAAWRAVSTGRTQPAYPFALADPCPAIRAVIADVDAGTPIPTIAARFHAAVATGTVHSVIAAASERGIETAVLAGGVFQNRLLLETVTAGLRAAGLRVLVPARLPVNDGSIAYGQAAAVAARLTETAGSESRASRPAAPR
jgi:hydrogenase maturation protein HypF